MAAHQNCEYPCPSPRRIRTAAIIENIVRYYAREPQTASSANNGSFPPQNICTSPTISTVSEATCPPTTITSTCSVELPPNSSRLPYDSTLAAFAQHAALRLDCERGFISLIDHQHQYVLAEATRSVSLHNSKQCLPGDEVWIGPTKFDLNFGLCPESMHVFDADDERLNVSSDNVIANQRCYVINDLLAIDCFKDKSYVSGWPFMRFYAEVPLKINGFIIGSVFVTDRRPGSGLDVAALDRLAEVAAVVASHLDLVQGQNRLERSLEMVRGLGRFVDGKSIREWWKDTFNGQFKNLTEINEVPSEQAMGFAKTLSSGSEHRRTVSPTPHSSEENSGTSSNDSGKIDPNKFDSLVATATNTSRSNTNDRLYTCRQGSASQLAAQGRLCSPDSESLQFPVGTPSSGDPVQKEQISNEAINHLFSRASHLIRDSSDLHGIIFVDASLQDIAITQQKQKSVLNHENTPRFGDLQDSSVGGSSGLSPNLKRNSSLTTTSTDLPAFIRSGFRAQVQTRVSGNKSPTCHLLGCSLRSESGCGDAPPSDRHINISQATLRGLLRRYPNGHVFLFHSDGSLLDDEELFSATQGKRPHLSSLASEKSMFEKEKEQLRAYQLLDICPGARAIIFFPLWDPQKDQWFAGSLAWTQDPARLLQTEDVTFLAAFGSCIMAEKSKMDALAADRAKADFISSVSHELRTPLHGILATMEVLAHTSTNMEQDELIRTVSTCGEVLMDTMDHILDYTKFNNSKNLQRLTMRKESQTDLFNNSKIVSFDLSNLVEGVVEGIFAGHNYRSMTTACGNSSEHARRSQEQKAVRLTPPSMNPDVMIILDIERQPNWLLSSQIGAWKRIITNLFGNALKYTETGYIRVSLHVDLPQLQQSPRMVTLDIEDSGIGMTQDFLKHNLYTPFAQANPLSVGTGLGLSIVRQLVNDLDGTIHIESEVGSGTSVKVLLPSDILPSTQPDEQSIESSEIIRDIKVWCKGLKLCLIGFNFYPEIEEAPTGILSAHARRMLFIRSSLSTLAADWFSMEVVTASSLEEARGDFLVGVQSQIEPELRFSRGEPLVVFEDICSGYRARNEGGVFHLSQPVGPHKFARILGLCLEFRSSVLMTPKIPLARATTYGFPPSPELPHDSEKNIPLTTKGAINSPDSCQMDALTVPQAVSSTTKLPTPGENPGPNQPVLVTPRSIVLLVEDNSVNMKILVNHMKRAKQEYTCAVNGLEALHRYQAEHQHIKVIFMDIAMPVKDGIAATKEIRQFEREASLPRVRIAALTCFSSEEYQRNAFAAGVDLFLVKPVPMKALKPILEMDPGVVVTP